MRRLLLATTAISALALAPALGLAQSNGSSGTLQEQPRDQEKATPKGGNQMKPTQGQTAPGKSAQTQGQAQPEPQGRTGQQHMQGQAQPEPQGRTGQQHMQGQAQPEPQGRTGKQQLQGQAQPEPQGRTGQQHMQGQAQPKGQERVQNQNQAQQPGGTTQRSTGTAAQSGGARGGQVQVTQQQRTQIHERLAHTRVERIDHPQFSVSVGAEIPRSVHVETLPPEIVEIVPEYEGYEYVMVGDQILIIDPYSLQIVAVIPA